MYTKKILKAFEDYNRDLIEYQELSDIVMEKYDKDGKGYRIWQWKKALWFWDD